MGNIQSYVGPLMKRRLIIVAMFLLAGAVVNVAVAWGCAAWVPASDRRTQDELPWPRPVPADWSSEATCYRRSNWLLTEINAYGDGPSGGFASQYVFEAGFPCRSLYRERHAVEYPGESGIRIRSLEPRTWHEGIAIPERLQGRLYLPTRPLLVGFAVDTLFYAVLLWAVGGGAFSLRRVLRKRRGLCVACGYDLAHAQHNSCPECGS